MKRVAWLTDIHLNFLSEVRVDAFLDACAAEHPDAVVISGDVGEAHDVCGYLGLLRERLGVPIYFVLGNHDFYHGSIHAVRAAVEAYSAARPGLHYLSAEGAQRLAPQVSLVGHDGWADGRLGDYPRSLVRMLDWKLIEEFKGLDRQARWSVLKGLADEAAAHIGRVLPAALAESREVMLVTHVPPFLEACWHEGRISDAQWAPHFTCHAMGQVILEIMEAHPQQQLTVLCGHTHGEGESRPRENVRVLTGGAEYGNPRMVRMLELE